jgi:cell division inhibitor SepF
MAGVWRKTLVYLGLAEEEDLDDEGYDDPEPDEPPPGARRANVRRLPDSDGNAPQPRLVRASSATSVSQRVHLVQPTAFNDAQEIGDKFRDGFSVLMNLQSVNPELGRRLVDFASGLAYGLAGSMQPVADKVFLITPEGVQVSAEERRRFLEERGFFDQA